ncbi:MAG TPA: DUF4269 domain-containing protein [Polyangiales bacterium]|nr:DUF4269 domain-containing protein [Polyangiales bacterium]
MAALFAALAPYKPTLVGTFPLGLQVEGSDLDLVCEAHDLDAFERVVSAFGAPQRARDASVTRFAIAGVPVEVFAQPVPVTEQLAFRHMVIEGRLLMLFGEPLRAQVLALKRAGVKTEPAFAQVLGLSGDPYTELLTLELLSREQLRLQFAL